MANKRRREQVNVDTHLIEIYEDLANINDEIRLKAAQALLLKVAAEANPTAQEINEILRRLLRGLCSSRKAARVGFSVTLTEVFTQLYGPTSTRVTGVQSIPELIETLKIQTQTTGNVSGEEEKDHQLGRIFGIEALVKSGILFDPVVGTEAWSHVLDLVLDLARRRSNLREECGWILYGAVHDLGSKKQNTKYTQLIIDKLHEFGLAKTPEAVAIWITVQAEVPNVVLPAGTWHNKDPLDRKEKAKIAKILKEASTDDLDQASAGSKASQKGNWTSKLHFAWDVVLSQLLIPKHTGTPRVSERLDFEEFWDECVDKSLFASSSSDERKYWGFLLFQRMMHKAPDYILLSLFSQNLMRCLMNQLTSPERYLYRIADSATKAIIKRIQLEPSAIVTALKGLLQPPYGRVNFDQSTKTKTVEKVLSHADESGLQLVLPVFRQLIMSPDILEEKAAATMRQVLADYLVSVVRSKQAIADDNEMGILRHSVGVGSILAMFSEFAYFTHNVGVRSPEEDFIPLLSSASQEMFKSRISTCLTALINKFEDPSYYTYALVRDIRRREDIDKHCKSLLNSDQNVDDSIRTAWKTLEKIKSKEKEAQPDKKQILRAFKLLYSLTILQVYNGDADAVNVLDELKSCYGSLIKHRKKGEQEGSEGLVEILLSFVARPSIMFRRLAQQVFSACASAVNKAGLQSMMRVLDTKENASGQEEIFDKDDEDAEDAPDLEDLEIANAHSDQIGADEAGSDIPSSETPPIASSNEDTDDDNVDEGDLAAFEAKLAQALGTKPSGKDTESSNESESTSEDMNDEQMEALDAQLVKIFRERKKVTSKKHQLKDAKETIVNFKCRVLELLEIFIKQKYASPLSLDLLQPLLKVIRTTTSSLVSSKACGLIRDYARLCKGKNVPYNENKDAIFDVLHSVHDEATKEGSNAYTSACSQASLIVVRVLDTQDRENLRQVAATYARTQERLLFDPQCKVRVSFFLDWLNWCAQVRK